LNFRFGAVSRRFIASNLALASGRNRPLAEM
jgi:hypothetical protein